MTVAFVFSGGASLGASQAGMLDALYARGMRPDFLVGTSVGAINAAFTASRPQTVQTAHELQRIWRGLSRSEIFPANPLAAGLGLLGIRDHSVSAASLTRLLREHLELERFEDAAVPLHIVASDAFSGEEVLLSEGQVLDAVLASTAIPGVFPPVPWDERMLVDGGIVNNTPISPAIELGADTVVVLPAIGTEPMRLAPRGALAAGAAAVCRAIGRRLADDIVRYSEAAELIVLPSPRADGITPMDFGHAQELIAESFGRAHAVLARGHRPRRILRAA